ncbi:TMEM175 family protein [Chloroflexota bacterium]
MKTPRFNLSPGRSERQNNLADGVFAFAMTLLVLGLGVPLVTGTSINSELTYSLVRMWPEFLIYILSFMILGVFWLMHHAIFDRVIYYDGTLAWFNIIFLMFVSLIPFSTALFGAYGVERIIALVYGGNLALLFTMLVSLFLYANSSKHRLTDSELDLDLVRGGRNMGVFYIILVLISMGISFVSPLASFIIYGVTIGTIILLNVFGKSEIAYIWPSKSDKSISSDTEQESQS